MVGHELRVEQRKAARPQPRDEVHQGDLRGVARVAEHALAEKRAAKAHAVKPAHQPVAVIRLDRMAVPNVVEAAIELADAHIDPGARSPRGGRGAAVDHAVEITIRNNGVALGFHQARKPRRDMETVERDHAALLGLDPVERRIFRALGHGKNPARIGLEQHLRRDFDRSGIATGHQAADRFEGIPNRRRSEFALRILHSRMSPSNLFSQRQQSSPSECRAGFMPMRFSRSTEREASRRRRLTGC